MENSEDLATEFDDGDDEMKYNGAKNGMLTEQCSAARSELQGHLVALGCPPQLEAGGN